jgi:hypothetical protein
MQIEDKRKRRETTQQWWLTSELCPQSEGREEKDGGPRPLYGLVVPGRLAWQACRARVAGTSRRAPRSATPPSINDACHHGAPCRASACGAIKCCSRTTRTGATKRDRYANIFLGLVLKYYLKRIKNKKIPLDLSLPDVVLLCLFCSGIDINTDLCLDVTVGGWFTHKTMTEQADFLEHFIAKHTSSIIRTKPYDKTIQFLQVQVRLSPFNTLTRVYLHSYKPDSPPSVTKDLGKSTSQPRSHD